METENQVEKANIEVSDAQQKKNFLALKKLHNRIHFNNQIKFRWAILGGTGALLLFVLLLQIMTTNISIYIWISLYVVIIMGMLGFYLLKIKKHSDNLQRRFEQIDEIVSHTVMTDEEKKNLVTIFEKNEFHYASQKECDTALVLLNKIDVVSYEDKTAVKDALGKQAENDEKLRSILKEQKRMEKKLDATLEKKVSLEAELLDLENYQTKKVTIEADLEKEQQAYDAIGADSVYHELVQTYQAKIQGLEKEEEKITREIAASEDELKHREKRKQKITNEQSHRTKSLAKFKQETTTKQQKEQDTLLKKEQEIKKVTATIEGSAKEEERIKFDLSQEKDEYKKEKLANKLETEKLYMEELVEKKHILEKEYRIILSDVQSSRVKTDAALDQRQKEEDTLLIQEKQDLLKIDELIAKIIESKDKQLTSKTEVQQELAQAKKEEQEKLEPFNKLRKKLTDLKLDLKISNEKLQQIPAKEAEITDIIAEITEQQAELENNRATEKTLKAENKVLEQTITNLRGW